MRSSISRSSRPREPCGRSSTTPTPPRRLRRRRCAPRWDRPRWTTCWRTARRSIRTCRRSSTSRPSPGESRSLSSRSRTSSCRQPCRGRWPSKRRQSRKSAPSSSTPTDMLAGLASGATFLFGAVYFAGILGPPATGASASAIGAGIMITAVVAAVLTSHPMRERVARTLNLDPDNPVHGLALVLAVILFGSQVSLVAFTDVLATDRSQPPLSILDLFAQEVPFLIIAATGVGLYIRRDATQATTRLGVVKPAWWQIALALAAAGVFFGFCQGGHSLI